MSTKRDDILDATCALFELQGYHATGLSEIIRHSGAPRGSLYHYFPSGKEALAVEAVVRATEGVVGNLDRVLAEHDEPAAAVAGFIRQLAGHVAASDYRRGGPLTAVAMEAASTSEQLRLACRDAYRALQRPVAGKLRPAFGARAEGLAAVVISAIEGGIILARLERSPRPLLEVATAMDQLLQAGMADRT